MGECVDNREVGIPAFPDVHIGAVRNNAECDGLKTRIVKPGHGLNRDTDSNKES